MTATEAELFDIYSGILFNSRGFAHGERAVFSYSFDCPEYGELRERYGIEGIAGDGPDLERALRLMRWMAPRLRHRPDYDNRVPMNSLALLEYSLDNPKHGINCRNKAVILTECCLALGIYARRVYIMPYSPYDMDNHVVTEVFCRELDKWVMLDPSTGGSFTDGQGSPLSLLELRELFAAHRPAAFTGSEPGDHMNAYFAKNLYRLMADGENGFGLGDKSRLYFTPMGYKVKENQLASIEFRLGQIPPDAMRVRKLFTDMLDRARQEPEPPPSDISAMEMRP